MNKALEMQIFCETVTTGGFTVAARRLDLSPSAVSKQISRLEDRLGVRLFNRTTRRLSLTEEGRAFFERSQAILADIEEAERAITDQQRIPRGTLKINSPVSFGRHQLMPLLSKFMRQHPQVRIELELTDRTVNLLEEGVDVLIRVAELSDSSHIARKLADNHRLICAAPNYLARYGTPQTPDDLLQHNCIRLNQPTSSFNDWEFQLPDGRTHTVHVSGNLAINQSDVIYTAVLSGMGLARLAAFLVGPDIKAGRLIPVLTQFSHNRTSIYAIYPHRRHLSSKVRAFVDFLAAEYTPAPPWETTFCKQLRAHAS